MGAPSRLLLDPLQADQHQSGFGTALELLWALELARAQWSADRQPVPIKLIDPQPVLLAVGLEVDVFRVFGRIEAVRPRLLSQWLPAVLDRHRSVRKRIGNGLEGLWRIG